MGQGMQSLWRLDRAKKAMISMCDTLSGACPPSLQVAVKVVLAALEVPPASQAGLLVCHQWKQMGTKWDPLHSHSLGKW